MYEDTISALEDEAPKPQAAGATPSVSPYAEVIGTMGDAQHGAAQAATFVGSQSNPDKAARAQELSKKLGVPPQAVEADLPTFEAQAKSMENSATLRSSPMLASWIASNPEAARVAHDDFNNLGFLEKIVHAAKAGFGQGLTQDSLAREGANQLLEGGEIKETDRERQLKEQLAKPDGVDGAFYNIVKEMSSFLGGLEKQGEGAAPIAAGGAAVGSAVPGVGTGVGLGAGFVAGMAKEGYVTGAGQIYNELKNLRDEDGNPLPPEVVRGAAHAGGLALGALNALNIQFLNKPFAKMAESLIPQLAKKVVERPTVARAVGQFAKTMATGGVVGAEFGVMSAVIMQGAVDLAKTYDSPDKWATVFNSEAERDKAIDKIVDSMESTALAFGVLHAAPASMSMAVDVARARKAVQDQSFMRSLADGSTASKVRERSPSAFQSYVSALTDGSPVENLYIPAEVVMKLYQDAGIDPKDRGADHLFPFVKDMGEQLDQALPVKGDVIVKTSDYATHLAGTDVDTALKNDLRVTPDSMTMNEAKQFFQDIKKELGERAKELKDDIGKADEPGDKIRTEVQKQLEEAGYKKRTAGGMAQQMAAFFQTVGKRMGIDPVGLFERYGLKIGRPEDQAIPAGSMEKGQPKKLNQSKEDHSFPESKVQDTVYHGTNHEFEKFKDVDGVKGWFSDQPKYAGKWASDEERGKVIPAHIDSRNPLTLSDSMPEAKKQLEALGIKGYPYDSDYTFEAISEPGFAKEVSDKGYDAIVIEDSGGDAGKTVIALTGAKIKNIETGRMMQSKRGYITFGVDRKVSISLLESSDLSTFLHESGHMYLEVLRDLTRTSKGTPLDADVQAIFKYLGVKDWRDIAVEHHEKFARSFEAYLMEGKAPSRELRGAFQRFRNWLTTIYEKITNLGVELTPEVRNVFDRLLATDEEILAARRAQKMEALFTDAKAAGMSDAEFAAYRKAVTAATSDAGDKLLEKVMGDVRRTRTAAWKDEQKKVREEEMTKVNARPDIQALHFLRTGEMLDGRKDIPAMSLSRQALESAYGPDILSDMPRGRPGHPLVVSEGGVRPDDVAQLFGFGSGDEMVKALVALEKKSRKARALNDKETRSVRDMLTDEATERRMKREHGDMLDDGSIKEEAMAAIHSEKQAEVLATELRALGRQAKEGRPMPVSVARDWARTVISSKTVGEISKYFRYAREEAKAARAVEKALLAGDHVEAMRQKQLQLLNHVLYMESRKAAEETDVAQRRLDGYASSRVLRNVDPDYLDQVHQLLERFDFATASDKEVEKRESLARWIDRQESDGGEVKIDDKLRSEAFRKHFSKLTLGEFRGLVDAADNIIHIGKLKNQLMDAAQERDLFEVIGEAVAQVANLRVKLPPEQRNPGVGGKGLDRISAKWLRVKEQVRNMDAALLKMEQVFDWLDQGDSNGVFNRIVFKRIAEAGVVEHDMRKVLADRLRALNAKLPKEFKEDFNTRYQVDELTDSRTGKPSQLLKSEILAIALNTGNASNFDKLLRGEKWGESAVMTVLDRHMKKHDWEFVQGVWDTVGELWPKIAEMEKRLSGVAPEKVEAREFDTQHGPVKGGYYPLVYDPLRSYDVELNRQRSADSMFERNYMRATTPHGHTIERTQPYARPLLLSLDVLPRHLQQVTHDLAYREAVIDADKFLSNVKVRKAVEETLGREIYMQFRPWLQAIANDKNVDQRGLAWWDKAAHWARTSATMVGLGFRFSTMFIHGLTAASNSIGELGPKYMLSGMKSFFGTPEKMVAARDFIFERSGEMRNRMNEIDRDVRDGLSDLEGKHGPVYAARRFAYYGISALDMASALPTWMGAYNKAMAGGMSEEQAVYAADKSVRVAHGAGHIKDLPAVQRGSEWMKLFTMFYSFWSHFYNRQRHMGRQLVEGGQKAMEGDVKGAAKDFSMVMARSVFYFIVPQLIHAAIRAKGKSDEDKGFLELAAEEIGLGFFAGIPVLRDVAHVAFQGKDYEATPAAQIVKSFAASAKDLTAVTGMSDRELSDRWVRHAMETSGYVFGLPLGQPAGSTQFLWDVMHGDQDPKDVGDWMHGVMYGKLKED